MKRSLVVLGVVAMLVLVPLVTTSCGSGSKTAKQPSPFLPKPPFAGPREVVFYGHVRSLTPSGKGFSMRVDPALWLGGITANSAAVADGAIAPGDAVPNDYFIRDDSHRTLTYVVPSTARVTVITNAQKTGIAATPISVRQLAQVVAGKTPKELVVFEPKAGFWIRAATDTVRSLDQQYQP